MQETNRMQDLQKANEIISIAVEKFGPDVAPRIFSHALVLLLTGVSDLSEENAPQYKQTMIKIISDIQRNVLATIDYKMEQIKKLKRMN